MNALRSISAQARKFRIRFFILPFPLRPLRWVSSEYALRSISVQPKKEPGAPLPVLFLAAYLF